MARQRRFGLSKQPGDYATFKFQPLLRRDHATKPKNVFEKPLQADFKALFKALAKGVGHTAIGKWEELGNDTVETLCAIGLSTEPGELAFLLVRRSITKAVFDLVGESASLQLAETERNADTLIEQLEARGHDFARMSVAITVRTTCWTAS